MEKIVVIGAGGLAREVRFLVEDINRARPTYEFLGYVVSDLTRLGERDSRQDVLGDYSWFDTHPEPVSVAIGIGTPAYRLKVGRELTSRFPRLLFPPLVHPNAVFDPGSCVFERGVLVCAGNILTVNIRFEEFSMLNLNCTVGHESVIGPGCVINPSVNISGGVTLGEGALVGTGAQVLQYLTVGAGAVVGGGACVTKDVEPQTTVVGIPAKPLRKA